MSFWWWGKGCLYSCSVTGKRRTRSVTEVLRYSKFLYCHRIFEDSISDRRDSIFTVYPRYKSYTSDLRPQISDLRSEICNLTMSFLIWYYFVDQLLYMVIKNMSDVRSGLRSEVWGLRSEIWNLKPETWDLRPQTSDLRLQTSDLRPQIPNRNSD